MTVAPPRSDPAPPAVRAPIPWGTAICAGVAVVLAAAPMAAIVTGLAWVPPVVGVVALIVAIGLLLHRAGPGWTTVAQAVGAVGFLGAVFTRESVFGLIPGPAAFRAMAALLAGAGEQVRTEIIPVPATTELQFLVAAAFALVTIAVYLAAVGATAPAAAGVPLLAAFAVPAALADDLLPWWSMVAAAAGFGLLLVARQGAHRQIAGGVALVALAAVVALVAGVATGFVGTAGRIGNQSGSGASGASGVGLSPFASLRGHLADSEPVELLRVRGLPQPAYLKVLTLRDFVPESGWQLTRPDTGPGLPGSLAGEEQAGTNVDIQFENIGFRDYWLPLYGTPLQVGGLPDARWTYDVRNTTAYTARPRQDESWTERAVLPAPTAEQLRTAGDQTSPGAEFLATAGVDPRVGSLSTQIVGDADTNFDKTMALLEYFTGPNSTFRYALQTAPPRGDDALVEFLTTGKQGFCEQFASAMAIMLRTVGVSARVAIGFTAGTPVGDYRSITTPDAHAWVEAWFPGSGWTTFDPTPLSDGRTIVPPYVAEALGQGGGNGVDDPATELDRPDEQQPTPQSPDDAPTPETPAAETPQDSGSSVPIWPFLLVAGLVALAVAPMALRSRTRRARLARAASGGADAATAAWEELLAESYDRGADADPSDTVRAAARRIVREHRLDTEAQQALRQVVVAVETSWYGGGHPSEGELGEPVRTVREAIVAGTPTTWRERLLPRSVLDRVRLRRSVTADEDDEVAAGDDDRATTRS